MNKETLKYVIHQFSNRKLPDFQWRELRVPTDSGKIISLIGPRRTGKTFLMFQTIRHLLDTGTSMEQIIYLNMEDDRLFPVSMPEMDYILKAHNELYPSAIKKKKYLFFDEIQNVDGWERYVRRIHDTENVSIFLTGSASALLQKDMATAMRGRSISFEIFPLSFREFLKFTGVEYVPYSSESEALVSRAFREYLDWGGFPEVVLADESLKLKIIQEYASIMLHRDLVERYGIRNEKLMRMLLKFCATHTASLISINKLFNDFSSQGLKLSKTTIYDYLAMLEDSYLVFSAKKYDASERRKLQAPQKIHLIDSGLTRAYTAQPNLDIGHRFETLVFTEERRKTKNICYYRNGFELDILNEDDLRFINVAWDMSDTDTLKREVKAMESGLSLFPDMPATLVYGIGHKQEAATEKFDIEEGWRYLLR